MEAKPPLAEVGNPAPEEGIRRPAYDTYLGRGEYAQDKHPWILSLYFALFSSNLPSFFDVRPVLPNPI
jgi:hypothetical protein